jgi:hypothetical protein
MFKKFIYHGSFAVLGVSLLLGMAILQANGLKTSENLSGNSDDQVEAPPSTDNGPSDVAAEPKPADEIQVAELPAAAPTPIITPAVTPIKVEAPKPVTSVKAAAPTPVKAPVEVVKDIPLDNVQGFAVYDAHRKSTTRQIFTLTPNGLRKALAYYKKLATHYGKRATVQAKVADAWTTIPATSFKHYIASNIDQ